MTQTHIISQGTLSVVFVYKIIVKQQSDIKRIIGAISCTKLIAKSPTYASKV